MIGAGMAAAYHLFTQKPKQEREDFLNWTANNTYQQGDDYFRLNGAGETLVFSAADFEDFRVERPEMPPEMELELEGGVRVLVGRHRRDAGGLAGKAGVSSFSWSRADPTEAGPDPPSRKLTRITALARPCAMTHVAAHLSGT